MKKINKRSVFSVVLCAMLVFCVGFYSSAQPTTAWFSDSGEEDGTYKMEEISVIFSGDGIGEGETKLELNFDASTRFADADERSKMFEHAAKYYIFTAENKGTIPARIKVDVVNSNTQGDIMVPSVVDNGLRYFIYEVDDSDVRSDGENLVGDVWQDVDGNCLIRTSDGKFYDSKLADKIDEKISEKYPEKTDFDELEESSQFDFLDSINNDIPLLDVDTKKTYCICFWVEYTPFMELATVAENSGVGTSVRTMNYNVDVQLSAEQRTIEEVSSSTSE